MNTPAYDQPLWVQICVLALVFSIYVVVCGCFVIGPALVSVVVMNWLGWSATPIMIISGVLVVVMAFAYIILSELFMDQL